MALVLGKVETYDDRFPKDHGPPPVPNYQGAKVAEATEPLYTITLEKGPMLILWSLLEHEARHKYPAHASMSSVRALLKAVEAFRLAYWGPEEPKPKRKFASTNGAKKKRTFK